MKNPKLPLLKTQIRFDFFWIGKNGCFW